MGKHHETINKNTSLAGMLVHWSSMNSLALNMLGCSDLCFLRFFRLLYRKDKRFLTLFVRAKKNRLDPRHYLYAKDALGKLGINV